MVLLNLLFQNFNPSDAQKESFKDLQNLLQNCIREVKDIAYNLLPPELEKGFLNAIERFAHRISSIGKIQFLIDIEEGIQEQDLNCVDKFNLYALVIVVSASAMYLLIPTYFTVPLISVEGNLNSAIQSLGMKSLVPSEDRLEFISK